MKKHIALLLTMALALPALAAPKGEKKMKHALIVVTNHDQLGDTGKKTGWYLSEVSHVYYPLIEAGYSVDFASPRGGLAPLDEGSIDLKDSANKKFYEDASLLKKMNNTLSMETVDAKKYQIIHFAGGHGVMWDFPNSKAQDRVAAQIYENGGIVAAVCHGPAALVNIKLSNGQYLVAGKQVSGFTNAEEEQVGYVTIMPFLLESKLKERGALFQGGKNWEDKTSVSERLVTGQNPQSAASVGKKIVELAKTLN